MVRLTLPTFQKSHQIIYTHFFSGRASALSFFAQTAMGSLVGRAQSVQCLAPTPPAAAARAGNLEGPQYVQLTSLPST